MSQKITISNINNFITGSTRQALDRMGLIAPHIREQAEYRLATCKDDCITKGACKNCGCGLPGRAFSTPSCDPSRFPDLMNEEDWNNYKQDNEIN